jgi:hypothetical protein
MVKTIIKIIKIANKKQIVKLFARFSLHQSQKKVCKSTKRKFSICFFFDKKCKN